MTYPVQQPPTFPGGPSSAPLPPSPAPPTLAQRIRRFPATFGLIGVTLLVFAAQSIGDALVGADVVLYYGAKINQALAAGEAWRLVTPIFLHAGLLHIAVNMYSLYALGPAVERFFGHRRFLVIYLLAGICGVLLSLVMSPNPSVGASGAIFGLLGCLAVFLFLHRAMFGEFGAAQLRQLVIVALANLLLGLSPGIDNWGHVGGLVAGVGLAWFAGPRFQPQMLPDGRARLVDQRPARQTTVRLAMAAAAVVLLSIIGMMNARTG